MTEQDLARLRQSGNKGTASVGDWLGLAIVDELCGAHGWYLSFRSTPGAGTRVLVGYPDLSEV